MSGSVDLGLSSVAFGNEKAPYPGLRPFQFEEGEVFFGRAEHIDQMLAKLEEHRFLAVVGASGSGKSSLVRAGLLPAVVDGFLSDSGTNWRLIQMRPGSDPFARLAEAFDADVAVDASNPNAAANPNAASNPNTVAMIEATLSTGPNGLLVALADAAVPQDVNVLLLVDQFEEIFRFRHEHVGGEHSVEDRRTYDERNRAAAFVNLLLATANQTDRPIHVVITMRSDFLGDCEVFLGLPEAINEAQFLTPRLTRDQIREVIVEPARQHGVAIEPALVNRILNDVGSSPDQLPLMQHALLRLWITSESRMGLDDGQGLLLKDYVAIGGVDQALSRHVDKSYAALTDNHLRRVAEHLFRCLCHRGAGGRWTRRMVTVQEVADVAGVCWTDVAAAAAPFQILRRNFIVSSPAGAFTPKTVLDISHEALIRQWGTLRTWIENEAESAAIYRRLAEGARLRERFLGEGHENWLVAPELNLALDWLEREQPTRAWGLRYDPDFELAIAYLEESRRHRDEGERTEMRRRRVRRVLLAVALVLVTCGLFGYAHWAKENARKAEAAQIAAERSEHKQQIGNQLLAAKSMTATGQITKGVFSYWRAYNTSLTVTDDSRRDGARRLLTAWNRVLHFSLIHDTPIYSLAVSPDGKTLVTGSGDSGERIGRAMIWDAMTGRPLGRPLHHQDIVTSIAFSSDGLRILTGSLDATVRIWDAQTGEPLVESIAIGAKVMSVALSPKGKSFAVGTGDANAEHGEAQLWAFNGKQPSTRFQHAGLGISSVAFSPDGQTLLTGGWDRTVQFWNVESGQPRLNTAGEPLLLKHDGWILSVALSPDGRTIVTGSGDNTARLWDAETGERRHAGDSINRPIELRHRGLVDGVAFSSDSKLVLTGSRDNTAQVWDAATGEPIGPVLRHDDWVRAVAFSPVDASVYTGSHDETARKWNATPHELLREFRSTGAVLAVAISSDGSTIATGGADQRAQLWNAVTGRPLFPPMVHQYVVRGLAFSPDGKTLVTGSGDFEQTKMKGETRFWDTRTGRQLGAAIEDTSVNAVAFNPDGRSVMTRSVGHISFLRTVVDDGSHVGLDGPGKLPGPIRHFGFGLAGVYSPDGQRILTGSGGQTARMWEADTGRPAGHPAGVELRHAGWVTAVAFSPDGKNRVDGQRRQDRPSMEFDVPTDGRYDASPLWSQLCGVQSQWAMDSDGQRRFQCVRRRGSSVGRSYTARCRPTDSA